MKKKKDKFLDAVKKKAAQKADKYMEYEYEEDYADDEAYYEDDEDLYNDDSYNEDLDSENAYDESGYEKASYNDNEEFQDEEFYQAESQDYEAEYFENSQYSSEYSDEYVEENQEEIYETSFYEETDYAQDTNSYYEYDEENGYDENYYESEEYDDESERYEYYEDDDAFDTGYEGVNGNFEYQDYDNVRKHENIGQTFLDSFRDFIRNMTAFDAILGATGVIVLVAAIVTCSMMWNTHEVSKQIEAIVPVGTQLSSVGIVGESGIMAMADAAQHTIHISTVEETTTENEEVQSTQSTDKEAAQVSVSFESLERDLKIRFTNSETGKLITGTVFEVVLTNSKGKQLVLTDDDADGVIYATNVNPGQFQAVITSTDKYKFPTTAKSVTVKDKVEYVVINVQDEVKTEAQVNVAVEDTEKVEAVVDEVKLTDTVEWVESSKTLIAGTNTYTQINKDTIPDPSVISSIAASRMRFATYEVSLNKTSMDLFVGNSDTLTGTSFTDSSSETENEKVKITYTTEWSTSDSSIASVDGGKVTAKAAGKATITYTVTKKTLTTKEVEGETTEKTETVTISADEYQSLVDSGSEEAKEYKEVQNDNGETVYQKTVTTKVPGDKKTETTEDTETVSATCTVNVSEVKISSASLELTKSADSCKVKSTVTVKPSKLVYTKNDGSTQTITDSFPTVSWSSSDTSIATIDSNGVVTGVKAGTVTITGFITGIKGADGNELSIKATTSIKIENSGALTVTLDRTSEVYLGVGGTTTLVATVTNYQSDNAVTWTTSNAKIATVNEKGLVTGVAAGKVTITATTKEKDTASGKQAVATCTVTINSDVTSDTTTKLKDKNGNQVYIKDKDGNYKEAVYADYFTAEAFYLAADGQYAYTGWQTINGKTYYYDKNGKPVTGAQIIQGVTYQFGSDGAIQTNVNGAVFGIDVSKHNGKIDWNAVKASGVDFVIIRCAYRGSSTGALIEDPNFHTNIKGATAAGLKVGIYLFSQAVNEVEAVKEASLAVSLAKGYNLTYPIFIDTEASGGRADKIDVATRTAVVNAFCQTVQSAGYKPGIYASKSWYESNLNMGAIGSYKIWLAQYASAPTYNGKYDMWQYSSKGKINGISGNVDLNYSYLGY